MNKSIWDMLFIKNIFIILGLFWGSRNVYLLMKNGMKGFTLIEIPGIMSFCVAIFLIADLLKCFSIKTGQKYLKSSAITFLIYWSMILLTILLEGSIHILVLGVYSLGVWLERKTDFEDIQIQVHQGRFDTVKMGNLLLDLMERFCHMVCRVSRICGMILRITK